MKALNKETINIHNGAMNSQPMILIPSSAFGALRRELIDTLGIQRAKGFLLRYGWDCGVSDGLHVKVRKWENPADIVLYGPEMHTANGHAQVKHTHCEVDFIKGTLHFEGDWINSNEAEEHIKLFGYSTEPVCHSLVGYASGYLSTIMEKQVIARETECVAMGAERCHWVCKTVEEWDEDPFIEKERHYYKSDRINDELIETYEKLRLERDSLSKTYDVHLKLFKEVIYETGLQSVANVLYETMKLPILIETLNCEPRVFSGISPEEAKRYGNEFKQWIIEQQGKNGNEKKEINQTLFIEVTPAHTRLVAPVYFRQNIYGYCSFLIEESAVNEAEKMVLGQVAFACSLHLLNERTRFNTEQRLRGSFLGDILSKRIPKSEIVNRAHYIDFELNSSYFMVTIDRRFEEPSMKEEIEFNDQFMNEIYKFLQRLQVQGLLGQKSGNVIILISESSLLKNHLIKENFCKKLYDYYSNRYPQFVFKMGISSTYASIEDASQAHDESMAALKVPHHDQNLIFFDSLGIIGMLLQTKNLETIEKFAYKILGNLIEEDKHKNMELTKTLYHYLENGSNVHKTARAMNFSISGLRYRLGRLNEILQMDLNTPYNRHEIYLALQSLIVLGELKIED